MSGSFELSPADKLKVEDVHYSLQALSKSLEKWIDVAGRVVEISSEFHSLTSDLVAHILEFKPSYIHDPSSVSGADNGDSHNHFSNAPSLKKLPPIDKSRQTTDYLAAVDSLRNDFKSVVDKLERKVLDPIHRIKNIIDLTPGLRSVYESSEKEYIRCLEKYCASMSPNIDVKTKKDLARKLFQARRQYYSVIFRYHRVIDQIQTNGHTLILSKLEEWMQVFRGWYYTDHKLLVDCLNFLAKDIAHKAINIEKFEEIKSISDDRVTFDMEDKHHNGSFEISPAPNSGYLFYYNPESNESWQRAYYTVEPEGDFVVVSARQTKITELLRRPIVDLSATPTMFQNRIYVVELATDGQLICYVQLTNQHEVQRTMRIFGEQFLSGKESLGDGASILGYKIISRDSSNSQNAPKITAKEITENLERMAVYDLPPQTKDKEADSDQDSDVSDESEEFTMDDLKDGILKIGKLFIRAKGSKGSKNWQVLKDPAVNGEWRATAATVKSDNDNFILSLYDNTSCKSIDIIPIASINRCDIQIDDETLFDKKYCFHIRTDLQGTFYLTVDSPSERNLWLSTLKSVAKPEMYGPVQYSMLKPAVQFRAVRTFWIRVVEAKELHGGPSFYCHIYLDDALRARSAVKGSGNSAGGPQWREDFLFMDLPSFYCGTSVGIFNQNKMLKDTLVGQAVVPIPTLRRGETYDGWYPILSNQQDLTACSILKSQTPLMAAGGAGTATAAGGSDYVQSQPLQKVGNLRLKLRYDEIVVLPSAAYERLLNLLLNYENHLIFDLAGVSRNLEWLSETVLKIFLTQKNKVLPWFDYLARHEVRQTDDSNILFRGNSVFTKSLDAYMKIVGLAYVEDTIGTLVRNICQYHVTCEVDPAKLAEDEDVGAQWKILLLYVRILWSSIEQSKPRCPRELKVAFSRLRKIIEEKFGNKIDPNSASPARYTCVSGFFFLRLICPAILSPKLYGLVKENPEPKVHRTLTLLAKSVQCLANLSGFGVKEPHMSPMNEFVMENSSALMEFIDFIATCKEDDTFAHSSAPSSKIQTLAQSHVFHSPLAPYLVDVDKELSAVSFFISRFRQDILDMAKGQQCLSSPEILRALVEECDELDKKTRACWTSGFLEVTQYPSLGHISKA
ncbi:hypothetical protein BJ085DRAFT_40104 [Dimargaris cristalligena]|uniref:Rho GTPase activation protein n=1 Tax=Dimargaris cristalligena TaxID=215637 RepID=A0A4P9ZWN1_9FUNG|nr:hypothetical protein BJ085DRAFT_40104 [Dimargaris cristalligena]|eukprot:RKP38023.1 hypothetical protein BJ085DRAFT_40104 [Dimargaris cristalligena]